MIKAGEAPLPIKGGIARGRSKNGQDSIFKGSKVFSAHGKSEGVTGQSLFQNLIAALVFMNKG